MDRNEFVTQYTAFAKRALALAQKARRESLLGLTNDLDEAKIAERDIFEYGMRFAVDGTDGDLIAKILWNIVSQEKDEYTRIFKTIQMEAVFGIQAGSNPKMLYSVMNSLTDIPLKEDKTYQAEEIALSPTYSLADCSGNAFDVIAGIDDLSIQRIMREVDSKDIAAALKAASKETQDKIFKNIGEQAVIMIKEDMEYMGHLPADISKENQQKILAIIRQLEDSGEIAPRS